jgi:hypothetical protein
MKKKLFYLFLFCTFQSCAQEKYDATIIQLNQRIYLYSNPNYFENNKFDSDNEIKNNQGVKILGRTNKKALENQKNDYWYLIKVLFTHRNGNNSETDEEIGWIHGSNLAINKSFVFQKPQIPTTLKSKQIDIVDCYGLSMSTDETLCDTPDEVYMSGTHYFIDDNFCITYLTYEDGAMLFLISKYSFIDEVLTINPFDVYYEYFDGDKNTNQLYRGSSQHMEPFSLNMLLVGPNIYFSDYSKVEKVDFVGKTPKPIKVFSKAEQEIIRHLKVANKL